MSKRKTQDQFLKECELVHGNKYDYSKFEYIHIEAKSTIICKKHGEFLQSANNHLRKNGCPECMKERYGDTFRSNKQEFIEKAMQIHQDKFAYEEIEYINARTKVKIFCNTCNYSFTQTPDSHLKGQGCPICFKNKRKEYTIGWRYSVWKERAEKSKYFDSYKIYIIECSDNETGEKFIKIGKTYRTVVKRFSSKVEMPYKYIILEEIKNIDSQIISELEISLKNKYKNYKYLPLISFKGEQECVDISVKELLLNNEKINTE